MQEIPTKRSRRVSVVIPTRNRPELLPRALASVAAQSFRDFEIIVVNDGEVDISEACRRAGGADVTVLKAGGGWGPSAARNLGARHARGEYPAFLDDDDAWDQRYLQRAVEALEALGMDMCATSMWRIEYNGRQRPGATPPSELNGSVPYSRCRTITGSNLVLRKALFERVGGYDEALPTLEDADLALRLSMAKPRYHHIPDRLVFRHAHMGAQLSDGNRAKLINGLRFYRKNRNRFPSHERRQLASELWFQYFAYAFKYKRRLRPAYLFRAFRHSPRAVLRGCRVRVRAIVARGFRVTKPGA